ncbi:hypothetical protein RJ55_03838 [Drechmeria coniospora]|nr:hypothetical protein RJ55_03838 [Drechmeria coniospora]
MAAADVDIGYIAAHLGVDEPAVAALTTEPTVDLVSVLLQAVASKAHEFDTLFADKLQTDIELENAVRSAETRSQTSKVTAEKALKEVEEARQRLKEEETKRQSLENELQILKSKSSDHAADVKALNDKIETLQSSNRTNLSIIEANNKRDQTVTDELTKQHQRNVDLSREMTVLQQSEQNAKGQLNSAKYREDSLKQQLELARRNGEWLETELKTKSEEALKYRKEKGARIAELQRESEDARTSLDALKRSEQQLRERLDAMQAKADEAFVKLQKQEGSFASTVESYKQELEDQRRLVDMSDQLSKKHQERVRDLEAEKERLKDNYENELRRVRLELEQERQTTTQMEEKVHQLESELDELQARLEQGPPPGSAPQTPRANGSLLRPASPFATPASARSKSAVTATQAIEQLYQVKGQLASERRRNQQLTEELDNMISALEAKAPEMQELQAETETLREGLARMSESSQQSFEDRDAARRAARKAESLLANAQSETKILKTQLRDLGTQIQLLVFNIYALEKGMDQLTEDEKFRLQQLEKGEITEEALSDMSDTHQFITQKLVVFKDIKALQTKNEDLMRITRELAEQIESEEALAAKHQAKVDHDNVEKLQRELEHMTEESKSIKNTMESYKMERDMFRRILQQRGVGGDEASMMRSSLDGSQRPPLASIEGDQTEALNDALRKLQADYDSYRDAQDDVRKDLRDKIDHLSSEKGSLQTERVKLQGDLRLESERREMLQSNYVALRAENAELQKRSQSLSEMAAKQDIRTQQVAEELIEAKGLLDSMRNETANLKAEKKLWRDIQDRMSKDNESLIEEKNRLNNLLATQQSLENERNLSDSEARRKAQAKIETLERELGEAQRKLSNEAEETKKLQLRKEYEAKESQNRIDELMTSLSRIREEHVSVKTSRDHLQARVDELTVELRNAEERVGRLQPRPTPRPGTLTAGDQRQQELESELHDLNSEISDLKRDLDLANTQLEYAKAQAEQYRELSQGNEEALEDLRASRESHQQEMEAIIGEKDAKIKELSQRIEDVSSELSQTNSELSTLRDSQGEVARKYEDEKGILDEELNRLKEDSARHVEAARYHQQDLRAQAEIATKAQQDYEQELVKHADAARLVQQLRAEHNELKSQTATLRAEAESARVTLSQSESSWEDRRLHLEQEMAELTTRREDANAQNKLLHQQLEALTAQVSALQQNRGGDEDDGAAAAPVQVGDALEGLRELNSYLRREKEILEVQYDLKSQESKRLQQQVEYVQSQLDDARLKLDQERTQAAEGNRNSMTHQDLMEKLNELNLYRESSATLRNENSTLKDQIAEKSVRIQEMEAKVQPLEAEIDSLATQKLYLEEEIKQIQEDRDRWQKRTEGILTKYGRVDPAEMETLKQTIQGLTEERDALKEAEVPLRMKMTELESTLESEREAWQTTRSRLTDQFKERSRKLTTDKNELTVKANELQVQLDQTNGQLQALQAAQQGTEDLLRDRADLQQQVEAFKNLVDELRQQNSQEQAVEGSSAATEIVGQLEQQLADSRKELESVNAQRLGAQQQLENVRASMQIAISERDDARQRLQAAATTATGTAETEEPSTAEPTTGEEQPGPSVLSDEDRKALEDKIAAAEAKAAEFEIKANETEAKIAQTVKERCDKMRDALNKKLRESRTKMDEEFQQKDADFKLRLEQEKLIWKAENPIGAPANAGEAPSTPAKAEFAQAPPATPTTVVSAAELSQLDDAGIRQFLSTNATVKSIIAANIKKRLEAETAKIKGDVDAKIQAARDQAQLMESKKSILRVNRAENRLKTADAKLGIIETAATETPQKPVVEVWEEVKKTTSGPVMVAGPGTPAKSATPAPAGGTPQPDAAKAEQPAEAKTPIASALAPPAPLVLPAQGSPALAQPSPQPASGFPPSIPANPFATSTLGAKPASIPANPFATAVPGNKPDGNVAPKAEPTAPAANTQGQAPRSGIPMPRGGGRGRGGGSYAAPGQRAASLSQEGGQGGQGGRGRGRGGFNQGGADASAGGNKRPRGESEATRGAKRARGNH